MKQNQSKFLICRALWAWSELWGTYWQSWFYPQRLRILHILTIYYISHIFGNTFCILTCIWYTFIIISRHFCYFLLAMIMLIFLPTVSDIGVGNIWVLSLQRFSAWMSSYMLSSLGQLMSPQVHFHLTQEREVLQKIIRRIPLYGNWQLIKTMGNFPHCCDDIDCVMWSQQSLVLGYEE